MKHILRGNLKMVWLAIPFVFAGCGDSSENQTEGGPSQDTVVTAAPEPKETTFYQVPAPNEMFMFIKEAGSKGKSTANLNNPEKFNQYNDLRTKSLNFGIYSTDLLYCSTFDLGAEVMKYFAVVKKMGDDLGVSSAITEADAAKIENSIGNPDSLSSVASDIYYQTYQTLEQNDQGKVLALMVAGGWLESLYLVTSMNQEYKEDNAIFQRIADQKLTLENLISYLEKYQEDAGVSETIGQFKSIQEVYNKLSVEEKGETTMNNSGGKRVLGGGSRIKMTADQYKELAAKIKEVRNNITGANA